MKEQHTQDAVELSAEDQQRLNRIAATPTVTEHTVTVEPVHTLPPDEMEAWTQSLAKLHAAAALRQINKPARDVYGEPLLCTAMRFDESPRTITLRDGSPSGDVYKSSFLTIEHGWIDSYTLACKEFAKGIVTDLARQDFPTPLKIVFTGQKTKRNRSSEDVSDTVRLIY